MSGTKYAISEGLDDTTFLDTPSSHEKFVVLSLRILKSFFAPYIRCSPPYLNNEHSLNRLTDTSPIHSYPDHCLQLPWSVTCLCSYPDPKQFAMNSKVGIHKEMVLLQLSTIQIWLSITLPVLMIIMSIVSIYPKTHNLPIFSYPDLSVVIGHQLPWS